MPGVKDISDAASACQVGLHREWWTDPGIRGMRLQRYLDLMPAFPDLRSTDASCLLLPSVVFLCHPVRCCKDQQGYVSCINKDM